MKLFKLLSIIVAYTFLAFFEVRAEGQSSQVVSVPPELQNLSYAVYPNSPDYNTLRLNVNKRFVYFPQVIFEPVTNEQIQFVVSTLKQYDLPFAVRSGGHCLEPGSLSPDFVIDLRNFNSIVPDVGNQQVYIGAGCTIGQIIPVLGQINYAIPTGTCPTVGITGLTMGGGIGFLSREFGLTCDSVLSITFLNADAQIIEVNASTYPDLFWALLGGGNGSYGIALGFTFRMYYIPEVTFYELSWEWNPKLMIPLMTRWQKWAKTLPNNITTVFTLHHEPSTDNSSPVVTMLISGIKIGAEPFNEWISAFEKYHPTVKLVQDSYVNTAPIWEDAVPAPFFKGKSRILTKPVTKKVMKYIRHFLKKVNKNNPNFFVTFNFESFGGNIPNFDTAFFPRKAFGWWEQIYYWDLQKQNSYVISIANHFYKHIPGQVSHFCYTNFVDYNLGNKYLTAYYGNHVNRLIDIKNIYDPTNLFHWKQSIPLKPLY